MFCPNRASVNNVRKKQILPVLPACISCIHVSPGLDIGTGFSCRWHKLQRWLPRASWRQQSILNGRYRWGWWPMLYSQLLTWAWNTATVAACHFPRYARMHCFSGNCISHIRQLQSMASPGGLFPTDSRRTSMLSSAFPIYILVMSH